MGKHSAQDGRRSDKGGRKRPGKTTPAHIERLDPARASGETPDEASRRQQRPDYQELRRRRQRRRRITYGVLGGVLALVLITAAAGFAYVNGVNKKISGLIKGDKKLAAALSKARPENRTDPFYMLVMGKDARGGETRSRSDTLMVARVDPTKKAVTIVSIPRDTRVAIPGHEKTKINAAAAYGGPALVIETVSDFTGLPISHYVEVDFNGFKELVDALGGVTVTVPRKILDPKAGNYDARYYKIAAGTQTLNGGKALTFVRSRNFPDGDISRIKNQQIFLKAVLREILAEKNPFRFRGIVDGVAATVSSDMSVGDMVKLASQMRGMNLGALETVTMPGTFKTIGGGSYVVVDDEKFQVMLDRIKQGLPAEETSGAASASGSVRPSAVTVAIRNGAGVGGIAADAAGRLTPKGFRITEMGNANQFVYEETLVVYKEGGEAKANLVRESLGMGKVIPSRGMYSFSADVLVVVGRDWKPSSATGAQ